MGNAIGICNHATNNSFGCQSLSQTCPLGETVPPGAEGRMRVISSG